MQKYSFHTNHEFFTTRGFGNKRHDYFFSLTDAQIITLRKFNKIQNINERGNGIIDVMTEWFFNEHIEANTDCKYSLILPNGKCILQDANNFSDTEKNYDGNIICAYNMNDRCALFTPEGDVLQHNMIECNPYGWYTKNLHDTDVKPIMKFPKNRKLQVLFNNKNEPLWISEHINISAFDNNFAAINYFNRGKSGSNMVIIHQDKGLIINGINSNIDSTWFDEENNIDRGHNLLVYYRNDYKIFNPAILSEYMQKNPTKINKKCKLNQFQR